MRRANPCVQNEKCTLLFAGELAAWNVRHVLSFHCRVAVNIFGGQCSRHKQCSF
jgi:hypothetical protein